MSHAMKDVQNSQHFASFIYVFKDANLILYLWTLEDENLYSISFLIE